MAGLTDQGWVTITYDELLSNYSNRAVQVFQDLITDPNDAVDTSADTTLGRMISLVADGTFNLYEVAQDVYTAFNPTAATGIALDNIVSYIGIRRNKASSSTVFATFEGISGTTVPASSIVRSNLTGSAWRSSSSILLSTQSANGIDIVIPATGEGDYVITATSPTGTVYTISYHANASETVSQILSGLNGAALSTGIFQTALRKNNTLLQIDALDVYTNYTFETTTNINYPEITVRRGGELQSIDTGRITGLPDTLTIIGSPVSGWNAVTNKITAEEGTNLETDEELRVRFNLTKYIIGTASVDAIYSGLMEVNGIRQVVIYENDTTIEDSNGVPPKSFMCIIRGGTNEEIADMIWIKKPAGIQAVGNITTEIKDSMNYSHFIGFSRPEEVLVYMKITIGKDTGYSESKITEIKTAMTTYVESIAIGDTLRFSRLFCPLTSLGGFFVNNLLVGLDPTDLKMGQDLTPSFDQIFVLLPENIEIEVT